MSGKREFFLLQNHERGLLLTKGLERPVRTSPSSEMVIAAINPRPVNLTPEEAEFERLSNCSEYEERIFDALYDLATHPPRFHPSPDDPALIECPLARFMRLGQESSNAGIPSQFYELVLQHTRNGLDLPAPTRRSMAKAQKYLDIKRRFVDFITTHGDTANFRELKRRFREDLEIKELNPPSQATIDDALSAYGLDWPAYSIGSPRKGKRDRKG